MYQGFWLLHSVYEWRERERERERRKIYEQRMQILITMV